VKFSWKVIVISGAYSCIRIQTIWLGVKNSADKKNAHVTVRFYHFSRVKKIPIEEMCQKRCITVCA